MAIDFETTNFGWQLEQLQQQVGEWIEHKLSSSNRDFSGFVLPNFVYNFFVGLAWIILSLTLAWLGFLLYKLVRPYLFNLWSRQIMNRGITVANSPLPMYSVDRWLKKAKNCQLEGNYTEACRALYMGMLQLLSDRHLILHQDSRTDGEYRELISDFSQSQAYKILLNTHEQLCFSDRLRISSEIFHTCQNAYSQINQEIVSKSSS